MGHQYEYLNRRDFERVASGSVPSIVLSYTYGNAVSRIICRVSNRWRREKHEYSHAMALVEEGVLATQGAILHKDPLESWLDGHTRLKIWVCEDWSLKDMHRIRRAMQDALAKPWYLRLYDAPGLVGQWLGNTLGFGHAINLSFWNFCSEWLMHIFGGWLPGLRRQSSPADIDRFCSSCGKWVCKGVYDPQKEDFGNA